MTFSFLGLIIIVEIITIANKFKKRYLKIAPKTGVVKPITSESDIMKINNEKTILFSVQLIFLALIIANKNKLKISHNSESAKNFKELPGSLGNGLNKLLTSASGMIIIS